MTKEELLQELSNKISMGEISPSEVGTVMSRFSAASVPPREDVANVDNTKNFSLNKMLYVLGGAIVVLGIAFFAAQVWDDIGVLGRVFITLGLGLILTAFGSILLRSRPDDNIGPVFHAIGGVLIPGGAGVVLSEVFQIEFISLWPVALMFGVIFVFYLILNSAHKHVVLTLFSIANGTAFVYFLVGAMVGDSFYNHGDLYAYLTMVVGTAYLFLAYSYRAGWNQKLVGPLQFLGIVGFLGAAFSRVFDSEPWRLFYFFIVIGGVFLSAYVRSRSILIVSTLFLVAHVAYITSKYFADSLGWPVSLILLGFVFIALGYISININKKYIKT